MNFGNEVFSCASRPVEAMIWINEIASAESDAKLKTSFSITGAELQTNFEVLDSQTVRGLKEIINGDFKRVFFQQEAAQKEERFLTGNQMKNCMYRQSHPSQFRKKKNTDVARKQKTILDNLDESNIDGLMEQ